MSSFVLRLAADDLFSWLLVTYVTTGIVLSFAVVLALFFGRNSATQEIALKLVMAIGILCPLITLLVGVMNFRVIELKISHVVASNSLSEPNSTSEKDSPGVVQRFDQKASSQSIPRRVPNENRNDSMDLGSKAIPTNEPATENDSSVRRIEPTFLISLSLIGIWLCGVSIGFYRIVIGLKKLRRVIDRAIPVEDRQWVQTLRRVEKIINLDRPLTLLESDDVHNPFVFGYRNPVVLLPSDRKWKKLKPDEMFAVLAHEAAHVVRKDPLALLVEQCFLAIFWIQPAAFVITRLLNKSREEICDDVVLQTIQPERFAEILLRLSMLNGGLRPVGFASTFLSIRWKLEHRVRSILDENRDRMPKPNTRLAVAAVLPLVLIVAAFSSVELMPDRQVQSSVVAEDDSDDAWETSSAIAHEKNEQLTTKRWERSILSGTSGKLFIRANKEKDIRLTVVAGERRDVKMSFSCLLAANNDAISQSLFSEIENSITFKIANPSLTSEQQNPMVTIDVNFPPRLAKLVHQSTLVLKVPKRFSLDLAMAGEIKISDIDGAVKIHSKGGGIQLGKILREVEIESDGGLVDADEFGANVSIDIRSGGYLELGDVGGNLFAHTDGGHITVGNVSGSAKVSTNGGEIRIKSVRGISRAETKGGAIRIGQVADAISAMTRSGDIDVSFVGKPTADSRLVAKNGKIRIGLPNDFRCDIDARCPRGRIIAPFIESSPRVFSRSEERNRFLLIAESRGRSITFYDAKSGSKDR